MQLISYAQNFEDIMLWRALGHIQDGYYVDVGAQSPDVDSVSRLFHERGWHGIHVEPTSDYAAQLRKARPRDLVIQSAIGASAGSLVFYEIAETGLSTSKPGIADKHRGSGFDVRQTVVPAMTLDDLLTSCGAPDVHWLKIDVEGAEQDVLEGWATSSIRPWVIIIESTLPMTQAESYGDWEQLLIAKGYQFAYFDGLNRFYVSNAHDELLAAFTCGPNIFDEFSLASSSAFCTNVNIAYHTLEQLRDSERKSAEANVAETQRRIKVAHADIARIEAEKLAQGAEFKARIEFEQQRADVLELLRDQYELREREILEQLRLRDAELTALAAQVVREQASLLALRDAHLTQINRFQQRNDELVRLATSAQVEQAKLSALRDTHLAQIDRFQAHVAWLDGVTEGFRTEMRASQALSDEAKREAHRWWIEAEQLRRQLVRMEGSRSWRITAPLRTAAELLRFPGRKGKVLARPAVVWIMRRAMAVPVVRVGALRLLEIISPTVKARLRNLALNSGLIHEPVALSSIPQYSRANFTGKTPQVVPTARAAKVLVDLRRAIEENHG